MNKINILIEVLADIIDKQEINEKAKKVNKTNDSNIEKTK